MSPPGSHQHQSQIGYQTLWYTGNAQYTVTRGQIPVSSIDISYMVTPQIGLIKVNKFGETTYSEFLVAIAKLKMKVRQNSSLI